MQSREINAIVWLVLYILVTPVAVYLLFRLKKIGYTIKQMGVLSLLIMIALRLAAFISEIVLAQQEANGYVNVNALVATIICVGAGYFGLYECCLAMYVIWAEGRKGEELPFMQNLKWVARAALILIIAGGAVASSSGSYSNNVNDVNVHTTPFELIQAGDCIFLGLTVILAVFAVLGIITWGFSFSIGCICFVLPFMLCRVAYATAGAFDFKYSLSNYMTPLAPEIVAIFVCEYITVCTLIVNGFHLVREGNGPPNVAHNSGPGIRLSNFGQSKRQSQV